MNGVTHAGAAIQPPAIDLPLQPMIGNRRDRSQMNVTFRLPSEELENAFIKQAQAAGLVDLKGHRSVGGMRASIYNAMPRDGVVALRDLMLEFQRVQPR